MSIVNSNNFLHKTVDGVKQFFSPLINAATVVRKDGTRLEQDGVISADYAADSYKLDGKDSVYYRKKFSNPRNLLDNSDFTNPVNQRGNTTITGDWTYGIDRWMVSTMYDLNPNGSILVTDNGLSMGYWTDMFQLIPFDQIKSKTLTFAVCTENSVHAYTMTLPESVPPVGNGSTYFGDGIWNDCVVMETVKFDNSDSVTFRFRNAQTLNQLVYWAALYEGTYTADNLPPYVPKGYAAELAECRRHCRLVGTVNSNSNVHVGYAQAATSTVLNGVVAVGDMRLANVSYKLVGDFVLRKAVTDISATITGLSVHNGIAYIQFSAPGLTAGDMYAIRFVNGGHLILSADW